MARFSVIAMMILLFAIIPAFAAFTAPMAILVALLSSLVLTPILLELTS